MWGSLGDRPRQKLEQAGFASLAACSTLRASELLSRSGIGQGTVDALQEALTEQGLTLKPEPPRKARAQADPDVRAYGTVWQEVWTESRGVKYAFDWHREANLLARWVESTTDANHFRVAIRAYLDAETSLRGGVWPHDEPPTLAKATKTISRWVNARFRRSEPEPVMEEPVPAIETPQADSEAAEVWRGVLEHLEGHVSHEDLEIWLRRRVPIEVTDDELVVWCEDPYYADWISENYLDDIEDALGPKRTLRLETPRAGLRLVEP